MKWKRSFAIMLAEFIMINHLVADIPADFSNKQFGSDLLRRVEQTLESYETTHILATENDERCNEAPKVRYTTPFGISTQMHMPLWNELLIDAIKCPGTVDKKFIFDEKILLKREIIFTEW